ncbi:MAG: DUF2911 domain-containing protein [Terracidiphilus sp.]|jgi:hypothetical protein
MKRLLVCASLLFVAVTLSAQPAMPPGPPKGPPKSPPATASVTIAGKTITITYNSPGVKGRAGHIFTKDGLISHDPTYPVWRAGANAATLLENDGGITAENLKVPAGKYTLYVDISDPDQWVLIINKQTGQWGVKYDKMQDLGRVKMTMSKPSALVENLKYTITDLGGNKGELMLSWETHEAKVKFVVH